MHLNTRTILQIFSLGLVFIIGYTLILNGLRVLSSRSPLDLGMVHKVATGQHSIVLSGHMFDAKDFYHEISQKIQIGTVDWFSPNIEKDAAEKFLGPPYEHEYHANQVSACFYDNKLVIVARVWLCKYKLWAGTEGRYLGFKAPPVRNNFNDNWLFYQHYDKNMVPISYSSFLGIPTPSQYKYMDGPTDPRLFVLNKDLYLLFNMDMALNETHDINYPVIWDFKQKGPIWIDIEGGSPFWSNTEMKYLKDRHWSPLVINDQLYFVYNIDPLAVLRCTLTSDKCLCRFVTIPGSSFSFNEGTSHLRGGTPFVSYQGPYYISFAHSSVMTTDGNGNQLYATHLVILSTDPTFRIVYISQSFEPSILLYQVSKELVKTDYNGPNFILPVGLIKEDVDTFLLTANVNDVSSVMLRITGIDELMKKVVTQDRYKKPMTGPIPNAIQEYVFQTIKARTDGDLVHQKLRAA